MKERLDELLVKRNLVESKEKAKAIIMSGNVFVEGQREDKVEFAWMLVPLLEDLPTVCCKTVL